MSSVANIPSENKCKQIFYEITHGGLTTCGCGQPIVWKANNDYGWCNRCRQKIRPKASSWLHSSNLTYQQLFMLAHCFISRQSPGSVINATNLSYPTIARWYRLFRQHLPPDPVAKLADIVEVDEAYFGKRRYGNQVIVIGAIERLIDPVTNSRRLKLQVIPDTEQDSLEKFLEDNVRRGSLVVTDCHMGYSDIEWLGYSHEYWNHSKGHFAGTNHIEQNWSAMKRYMRKLYGSIPTTELELIMREWVIRHNKPEIFTSPEVFLGVVVPD